jgi:hypothetical protein
MKIRVLLICAILFSIASAQTVEKKNLSVTVYSQGFGAIKDVRSLKLEAGINNISIKDVAEKIDPSSVYIRFNGEVIEQNYSYDLANMDGVLQKYLDKSIRLINDSGDVIKGKLISAKSGGIIVRKENDELVMLPDYNNYIISTNKFPERLMSKPSLLWTVKVPEKGRQDVEVSYKTDGMKWHSEYVAILKDNDTKIDLKAWVSIENKSGTTYKNAKLKLVAGQLNIIEKVRFKIYECRMLIPPSLDEYGDQFAEKSFFEYHIYNLQHPATILNNETKQISLFDAENVPVTKKYLFRSGYDSNVDLWGERKVSVTIECNNNSSSNLGMPIPAGIVRLYKTEDSAYIYIGKNKIDHISKNEKILLKIGEASEITAKETVLENKKISDNIYEKTWQVVFYNHKNEDAVVEVNKYMGGDWEVLNSTYEYKKDNAHSVTIYVPAKKDSESILTLKTRYTF